LKPKAIIFDLDGLLIDSEPFWYEAEKIFFQKVGIELSDADCLFTAGMRIDGGSRYWYERYPWPAPPTVVELAMQMNAYVIQSIRQRSELLPGAAQAIQYAVSQGVKIGLASSSHLNLVEAALETFDLRRHFQAVASSEFSGYSKPHPAVYLDAAEALGIAPAECLAVEDSINGLIAAKAAGMKCLAVPSHGLQNDPRFVLADYRLDTLEHFNSEVWQ
jgi:mannitol-1-/sugar-/sorbitol-6-/2-deoxyglucose-6-phosphatase